MNIDTDKLVEILKKEEPLSVMVVEDSGIDKLVCMFTLPDLLNDVQSFAKSILDGKPTYEELVAALSVAIQVVDRPAIYDEIRQLLERIEK